MSDNPTMGAAAPVAVKAVWKEGVVRTPENCPYALVAHAPPGIVDCSSAESTVLSYCPVGVAGCYSMVLMIQAALQNVRFDSYETHTTTTADLSAFYGSKPGQCPWKDVDLNLRYSGPHELAEIEALAKTAEELCPSVEVLERPLPVQLKLVDCQQVECSTGNDFYKLDAFREPSATTVEQSSQGVWNCARPPSEGIMKLSDTIGGSTVTLSQDAPMGPGGPYPNPVQVCFFGSLAFTLHTLALQLTEKGYSIQTLTATLSTTMNKRKVLDVDRSAQTFPDGVTLELTVASTAPVQEVQALCDTLPQTSPGLLGFSGSIPLKVSVSRVE